MFDLESIPLSLAAVKGAADAVPLHRATAGLLVAGALVTILVGLIRSPPAALRCLPGAIFLLLGGALYWPLPTSLHPWTHLVLLASAAALLLDLILTHRWRIDPAQDTTGSPRVSAAYLGAALLVAGVLLFHNL